jgi:mono/diheme cytochrome c family protein
MDTRKFSAWVLLLGGVLYGSSVLAQSSQKYGLGRAPTAEEMRALDISIGPDGAELPQGHGSAKEGALLFQNKGCAGCHGKTGTGGAAPELKAKPCRGERRHLGPRPSTARARAICDDGLGLHQSRDASR